MGCYIGPIINMRANQKPSISAVINTLNEENNIDACLQALQWCDEIIVVDMESDDNTIAIARQYTNNIFSFNRKGCVEPARRYAVSLASCDWVLIVDADELVPHSLSVKLGNIAKEDLYDLVYIPFKTYIFGEWIRHSGWWPDYHPRFFKRGSVDFSDQIHSQFVIIEEARRYHLPPETENAMEHFAFVDIVQFIEKLNKYTTAEAMHLYETKCSFSCFKMFIGGINEFLRRYFRLKGYKDGYRGLFLSLIMAMYRITSSMKLWEIHENEGANVSYKYRKCKHESINKYHKHT